MKNNKKPSVYILPIGCKLNQYETDKMYSQFIQNGFAPVNENADICIINTCTVTNKADRKSRNLIRRVQKKNPKAKIVVTGCYATTNPKEIEKITSIDLIVDNAQKKQIYELSTNKFFPNQSNTKIDNYFYSTHNRIRPFVKIQEGCSHRCSYCKIWQARGQSISVPPKEILKQIEILLKQDYKEIVITGVNILDYYYDRQNFSDLLELILSQSFPIRYRLSSLFPQNIDDRLIEILTHKSICNHFHLSLQSASPTILKKMNRFYDLDQLKYKIDKLQNMDSSVGFGADIIVGFPGETDEMFLETYRFIEKSQIPFLHIFKYSKRMGTVSATFTDELADTIKTNRSHALEQLKKKLLQKFYKKMIGQQVMVLIQESHKGLGSNYLEIYFEQKVDHLKNQIVAVKISKILNERMYGELCE